LNFTPGLSIETENGPYSGGDVITGGPVYFIENGARLASFTKPFAVDAVGSRIDLVYELSEKRGSQTISTIVPGAWLADPQRVYPITIDPTLSSSTFNVTEVVALAGGRSSIASPEYNMTLNFGEPSIGQSANSTPSPATGFIAQLGFFYTAYDITAPLIGTPTLSVSSPTKEDSNIQVNSTWSDNLAVSSCEVTLSGATSGAYAMTLYNSTVGYSTGTASKTISSLNDGTTNFQVHCHDTSGNIGTSTTTSLTVDSTPPTVTFVSPTPPNSATFNNRTITINATATDTANSISSCTLEFGGANESMNLIGSGTSVVCTKTKVSATDGAFTYKVFADDSLGNTGVSESRTITFSTALVVFNVSIEDDVTTPLDQIDLVANGTRTIYGTATVNSGVGISDFNGNTPTSRFRYTADTGVECSNNYNNCYVNSSCVYTDVINDTTQRLECTFTLQYNAVSSTGLGWKFNVTAKDTSDRMTSGTDTTDINKLLAIEIPTSIDFGAMTPGTTSGENNLTVTNYGNVQLDMLMNGTDMGCSIAGTIPVGSLHYNCTDYGQEYDKMTALTTTLSDSTVPCSGFNLGKSTDITGTLIAPSKPVPWRLNVPTGTRGTCSGTILFVAIAG
jgi:hypothetical protein